MKMHLESAGIRAWLADEGVVAANPLLSPAVGGIKVQVEEKDEATAREAIADFLKSRQDAAASGEVCLSCGAAMSDDATTCSACGWTFLDKQTH